MNNSRDCYLIDTHGEIFSVAIFTTWFPRVTPRPWNTRCSHCDQVRNSLSIKPPDWL